MTFANRIGCAQLHLNELLSDVVLKVDARVQVKEHARQLYIVITIDQ